MAKQPVYQLARFQENTQHENVYVNRLPAHLKSHEFIKQAHKHDFFLVVLITRGSGTHEIDFKKYKVAPSTLFLMQPGQMHYWQLSADIDGYVFFHDRLFYEELSDSFKLSEFTFFRSAQSEPYLKLSQPVQKKLAGWMQEMYGEYKGERPYRLQKIRAFLQLFYLEVAAAYKSGTRPGKSRYLSALQEFEKAVEQHFRETRSPAYYAGLLKISEKHLNRVCRESVNKTSTEVISERVMLEARRLLQADSASISDVAFLLGFEDPSYFSRFFRKHAGITPLAFVKKVRI